MNNFPSRFKHKSARGLGEHEIFLYGYPLPAGLLSPRDEHWSVTLFYD